ncbi:hypothetical protein [Staphylococcus haemolyticus]|uniref:hypothetical protein n=1 Tax=Staphylococcus haemolyticus TaxID=1283 RepID=UPI001F0A8126|nr:hypothetical protein [Staphylococcus haemolyticus]MCH4379947.1 hypothetical protein [Staphylococcus haemolyticus]
MNCKQLRKILVYLLILGIVILIIYLLRGDIIKGIKYLKRESILNSVITGVCTIISAVIAIIGVHFTINNSRKLKNQELLNELDQKSEWRKELMNIAARPSISTKDVYRVLASLRFLPKTEIEIYNIKIEEKYKDKEKIEKFISKNKDKDFDVISNYIYNRLIEILNKRYIKNSSETDEKWTNTYLSIRESEEIRLYILFLLKHHWEYNQSEEKKKKFINIERQEFEKVIKQVEQLDKGFESFYIKGYENFKSEEEKFKDFEIPIKSANKDLKYCIKEQKKNKEELIVQNLTVKRKCGKTILKGQYKRNK